MQPLAAASRKTRCAFHAASPPPSPRDAARLRGVLRVLREWVLARSSPASPLARACALHLLCQDAGFLHDAGMMVVAGLCVCFVILLAAMLVCELCERVSAAFPQARSRVPVRCICCAEMPGGMCWPCRATRCSWVNA